jgi:hypothetical protein
MIPNKTEVLNLKTRKIQVPIGYLSLSLIYESFCVSNVSNHAYLWLGWKMALCLKKK